MTKSQDLLALTVGEFVDATASKQPTPGGGSVAGLVGALSVALGEMALAYTKGKQKYAAHAETHTHLAKRLLRARQMFAALTEDDAQAYGMYSEAMKTSDKENLELALAASIDIPREIAKLALAVLEDLLVLAKCCNPQLASDLVAAAVLAEATVSLCDLNVRINSRQWKDASAVKDLRHSSAKDRTRAMKLAKEIETATIDHL